MKKNMIFPLLLLLLLHDAISSEENLDEKKRALKKLFNGLNREVPVVYNREDSKLFKKYMQAKLHRKEEEEVTTFWGKQVEQDLKKKQQQHNNKTEKVSLEQQLRRLEEEEEGTEENNDDPEKFQFTREIPRKVKSVEVSSDEVQSKHVTSNPARPGARFIRRRRPLKRDGFFSSSSSTAAPSSTTAATAAAAASQAGEEVDPKEVKLSEVYNLNGVLYRGHQTETNVAAVEEEPDQIVEVFSTPSPPPQQQQQVVQQPPAVFPSFPAVGGEQSPGSSSSSSSKKKYNFRVVTEEPVTPSPPSAAPFPVLPLAAQGEELNNYQTPFTEEDRSVPVTLKSDTVRFQDTQPAAATAAVLLPKKQAAATTPKYQMQLITEEPYTPRPSSPAPTTTTTTTTTSDFDSAPIKLTYPEKGSSSPSIRFSSEPQSTNDSPIKFEQASNNQQQQQSFFPLTQQDSDSPPSYADKPFKSSGYAKIEKLEVYYKPVDNPGITPSAVYYKPLTEATPPSPSPSQPPLPQPPTYPPSPQQQQQQPPAQSSNEAPAAPPPPPPPTPLSYSPPSPPPPQPQDSYQSPSTPPPQQQQQQQQQPSYSPPPPPPSAFPDDSQFKLPRTLDPVASGSQNHFVVASAVRFDGDVSSKQHDGIAFQEHRPPSSSSYGGPRDEKSLLVSQTTPYPLVYGFKPVIRFLDSSSDEKSVAEGSYEAPKPLRFPPTF